MTTPLETHYYDGKLLPCAYQVNESLIQQFSHSLTDLDALRALHLITTDLNGNWDPLNKMDARELLTAILSHKDINEIKPLLIEQLGDIVRSGPCPQGRVIRLYQILKSLVQ